MLNLSSKESELTESELTELELTQYLEGIKEFGFNHIIIVGERDYRVFFLTVTVVYLIGIPLIHYWS